MTESDTSITKEVAAADTQSALEPPREVRFDPPPPSAGPQQIENVLNEVEQLTHGIDAILRAASNSTIGSGLAAEPAGAIVDAGNSLHPDAPDDSVVGSIPGHAPSGVADDAEMMQVFDEDDPCDIRAIDRMLSHNASDLLEGEFHAVEDLLAAEHAREREVKIGEADLAQGNEACLRPLPGASPAAAVPAPSTPGASIAFADPPPVAAGADEHASSSLSSSSSAAIAAPSDPAADSPAFTDHAAIPAPASGLASSASPASMSAGSATPGLPAEQSLISATLPGATEAQMPGAENNDVCASLLPLPGAESAMPAERLEPSEVGAPSDARRRTPAADSRLPLPPQSQRSKALGSALSSIAGVIALSNIPLRLVPESLRPAMNILALSLVLWAPLVWWIGPKLAQRFAASAASNTHEPSHQHSAIRHEDAGAHAESKPAGHGGHAEHAAH